MNDRSVATSEFHRFHGARCVKRLFAVPAMRCLTVAELRTRTRPRAIGALALG